MKTKSSLLWKLFVPLLALSALFFGTAWKSGTSFWSSFFLNLSTDLLVVIVTIWYVDKVLKRHEESYLFRKWSTTNSLIELKIAFVSIRALEDICKVFGVQINVGKEWNEFIKNLIMDRKIPDETFYLYFAKKLVKKRQIGNAPTSSELEQIRWAMKLCYNEINNIVDQHSFRLSPRQTELLLDAQISLKEFLTNANNILSNLNIIQPVGDGVPIPEVV